MQLIAPTLFFTFYIVCYMIKVLIDSRGRILGRNPDKSLKSFPPCYSQSPPQFCIEISISSLYTVKEKGGKPDIKPCPLPYGLRNPYKNLKSENTQNYSRNHNETVRS